MKIINSISEPANNTFKYMISSEVSPEIRIAAARRYTEIIIDLFLSEELKKLVGE